MTLEHEAVFDRERLGAKLAERLAELEPCLVPLANTEVDIRLMADYDLTSFVTSRCGENLDPDDLQDPKMRDHWVCIATNEGEDLGSYFGFGLRPHWIVHEGERIGTMGYLVHETGFDTAIELFSVYVRPRYRRNGWASRILQRIRNAAFDVGIDRMLVSCEWGNQNALQFYLAQGLWVHSWKRNIRMCIRKGEPALSVLIEGSRATFYVDDRVIGIADNQGERLGWQLLDADLQWQVEATVPVCLALMDWPTIRSDEQWQKQIRAGTSDGGAFESLALRIRSFERHLRRRGWKVPAPNPSFAAMPKLAEVQQLDDRFDVTLSDGRSYALPYEVLEPTPTTENPLTDVSISEADDLHYTLRGGEQGYENVDHILWLNQSAEHLQEMVGFWTEMHGQKRAAKAKRAAANNKQ